MVGVDDQVEGVTYPLLMAVIHVDKGDVTGITWDSTCSWCDTSQCGQSLYDFDGAEIPDGGNCFVKDISCVSDSGTTRLCELNVRIHFIALFYHFFCSNMLCFVEG